MAWFDHILFWHWWILAGMLLIIELTLPAFFFLWLGIAAAATGLIMLVFPSLPLETQLIIFSVLSVIAIIAWRRYRESHPVVTDQPNLNRRGRQYVGRVFTLEEPVVNGVGKVTVDDSTWRVRGPDLPAGTLVRVTGVDGTTFIISPDRA